MSSPNDQNETIEREEILENSIENPSTTMDRALNLLAGAGRAGLMAVLVGIALWATDAHTEEPKDQTALKEAAKANDAFKVMQELIKISGKGYRFAGLQQDGKVVQCGEGNSYTEANKIGEEKVREILKGDIDLSALLQILDNKKWIVCATGSPKETPATEPSMSEPDADLSLTALPDPKVEIFKAMGELIQEFGKQYRFAGPQQDGTVIQCANGKKLKKVKKEAEKKVKEMMPNGSNVKFKTRKIKGGIWVVAALGRPLVPVGRTRGGGSGEAVMIDPLSTSGGGNIESAKKGKEARVQGPETTEKQGPQAVSTDELPPSLTKQMYRKMQKAFEGTLKQYQTFSGKVNITFHLKNGKVEKITAKGKQPHPMLMNFEVELLSQFAMVKFPKDATMVTVPLVLETKH